MEVKILKIIRGMNQNVFKKYGNSCDNYYLFIKKTTNRQLIITIWYFSSEINHKMKEMNSYPKHNSLKL